MTLNDKRTYCCQCGQELAYLSYTRMICMDCEHPILPNSDTKEEMKKKLIHTQQALNNALEALQLLLKAKHIKETFGKNAEYEELKERGWKAAEMVVTSINKEMNND